MFDGFFGHFAKLASSRKNSNFNLSNFFHTINQQMSHQIVPYTSFFTFLSFLSVTLKPCLGWKVEIFFFFFLLSKFLQRSVVKLIMYDTYYTKWCLSLCHILHTLWKNKNLEISTSAIWSSNPFWSFQSNINKMMTIFGTILPGGELAIRTIFAIQFQISRQTFSKFQLTAGHVL